MTSPPRARIAGLAYGLIAALVLSFGLSTAPGAFTRTEEDQIRGTLAQLQSDLAATRTLVGEMGSAAQAAEAAAAQAKAGADQASAAAAAANQAASSAQSTANQALAAAQAAQSAVDSTNEKIDDMFKKSISK